MGKKDSGIKWIGEIPENWQVKRFKYFINSSNAGEVIDKEWWNTGDEILYTCSREPLKSNYDTFPNWKRTRNGDILLTRNGTPYIFLPSNNCIYSNVVQRLKLDKDSNIEYIKYYLQCASENMIGNGFTIPSFNMEIWGDIDVAFPNRSEQKAIADYLNDKVGKIDDILNDLIKQVEILSSYKTTLITEQFKSNKITKVKYIGELQNGMNFDFSISEEMVRFLGVGDFKDNYILDSKNDFSQIPIEQKITRNELLQNGDIVFVRSNGSKELVGRSVMVDKIDYPLTYSGFCIRLRPNRKDILNKYLLYFFKSNLFRQELNKGSMGTNITNLSQPVLGNILVPICKLTEQQRIVDFLDKKCAQLDELIFDKQAQIEKMESYRKSLIYEYVTGKKRVKGEE